MSEKHRGEMERRGIYTTAKDAGWKPHLLNVRGQKHQGFIFPIFNRDEQPYTRQRTSDLRWKNLNSGGDPKYYWPLGMPDGVVLYALPGTQEAIIKAEGEVWITGGEPDNLVLHTAGIHNVINWFGEVNGMPSNIADILHDMGVTDVQYPFDLDTTGFRSALKLWDLLDSSGIAYYPLLLPFEPTSKADVGEMWINFEFNVGAFAFAIRSELPVMDYDFLQLYADEDKLPASESARTTSSNGDWIAPDGFLDAVMNALGNFPHGFGSKGYTLDKCNCPFHDDNRPSANWHQDGWLRCHVCDESFGAVKTGKQVGVDISNFSKRGKGGNKSKPIDLSAVPDDAPKPAKRKSSKRKFTIPKVSELLEQNETEEVERLSDLDAERAFLAVILRDPELYVEFTGRITTEHFSIEAHDLIWRAIETVCANGGLPDTVLIKSTLNDHGVWHLTEAVLEGLAKAPGNSKQANQYAQQVVNMHSRRALLMATQQITKMVLDRSQPILDVQISAQDLLFKLPDAGGEGQYTLLTNIISDQFDRIERVKSGEENLGAITTGFRKLDDILFAIHKTNLIVVAGRPGMGKTSFAVALLIRIVRHYGWGLMFSAEQSYEELGNRFSAMEGIINLQRMISGMPLDAEPGVDSEMKRFVSDVMGGFAHVSNRIVIDETSGRRLTPQLIVKRAQRVQHESHGELKAIFVDYMQKMSGGDGFKPGERFQEVSHIARSLKDIAKELKIPVFALAQLNRSVEKRKGHVPRLDDLRETGEIEQEADSILFLVRDEYYTKDKSKKPCQVDVHVGKQRNGPTGMATLGFYPPTTAFYDLHDTTYNRLLDEYLLNKGTCNV